MCQFNFAPLYWGMPGDEQNQGSHCFVLHFVFLWSHSGWPHYLGGLSHYYYYYLSQVYHLLLYPNILRSVCSCLCFSVQVVVVVVVDSHIHATEETTVTQQVSHRPIKCQSRLWLQRGAKVNGSHHGDNPLLRPTGIKIVTKRYAALQAMAPTDIKTVHQTSLLHTESNLDRLGMLSPTNDQRSQQKIGKITLQPVLINKPKFLKATHCTEIRKIEIPRSMVVEALSW